MCRSKVRQYIIHITYFQFKDLLPALKILYSSIILRKTKNHWFDITSGLYFRCNDFSKVEISNYCKYMSKIKYPFVLFCFWKICSGFLNHNKLNNGINIVSPDTYQHDNKGNDHPEWRNRGP